VERKQLPWYCVLVLPIQLALAFSTPRPHHTAAGRDVFEGTREEMVSSQLMGRDISDQRALEAMREVPRERFVPPYLIGSAYEDRPLPIGYGQTISQPYIVALMTQLLLPLPQGARVLEVGTGSGYQAAVLSKLAGEVYTVEIIPPLAQSAETRLKEMNYRTVHVKAGDGYYGWKEHAPFDGIVVTAAATHVPPPLIEQLREGGRMAIPVGSVFFAQYLMLIEKKNGKVTTRSVIPVRFVPLTGVHEPGK